MGGGGKLRGAGAGSETSGEADVSGLEAAAFRHFPHGILVLDADGRLQAWNEVAAELLGELTVGNECCALLRCGSDEGPPGRACFTTLALAHDEPVPEVRVELDLSRRGQAAWVTAARLGDGGRHVVVHLRPGATNDRRRRTNPHWSGDPVLYVKALGRTDVSGREGRLDGRWLDQRPGQILKYLLAERGRVVPTDEIADAIWPDADMESAASVRYYIHALRARVEPERERSGDFSFVVSRPGGYALDRTRVKIDADDFERSVRGGLLALRDGDDDVAASRLEEAVALYRGDFLEEERYEEWALAERDRLRKLASDALRALREIRLRGGDLDGAIELAARLAELQPFDPDVHRDLLALLLAARRRSDAMRHYAALRRRMLREFGEQPEFKLADVQPVEL